MCYINRSGKEGNHSFDPLARPTVTAGSDHCPPVPNFQNKTNFKRKQCSLLAILWVWSSGSLRTPVLFLVLLAVFSRTFRNGSKTIEYWSGNITIIFLFPLWHANCLELVNQIEFSLHLLSNCKKVLFVMPQHMYFVWVITNHLIYYRIFPNFCKSSTWPAYHPGEPVVKFALLWKVKLEHGTDGHNLFENGDHYWSASWIN